MQHRIRFFLRATCVLAYILGAMSTVASAQEKLLRWHDSLERGAECARESGKPLFVVFRCVR
jgi:hypothetical protein